MDLDDDLTNQLDQALGGSSAGSGSDEVAKLNTLLQEAVRARKLAENAQKEALAKVRQIKEAHTDNATKIRGNVAQLQQRLQAVEQQLERASNENAQLKHQNLELKTQIERSREQLASVQRQLESQKSQVHLQGPPETLTEAEQQLDLKEVMDNLRAARMLESETKQQVALAEQQEAPMRKRRLLRYVLGLVIAGDLAALYYLRDQPFMAPVVDAVDRLWWTLLPYLQQWGLM